MNGKLMLYLDQYGNRWFVTTLRDLREVVGGGRVSKMYRDGADGQAYHTGYVIGDHWCTAYVPYRGPA